MASQIWTSPRDVKQSTHPAPEQDCKVLVRSTWTSGHDVKLLVSGRAPARVLYFWVRFDCFGPFCPRFFLLRDCRDASP